MNKKNVLIALAAIALAFTPFLLLAGEIVEPEIVVRDGALCTGLRVNLHEIFAPEAKAAERRALQEAAFHPTPGNIAALAALRGEQAHAGQIRQIAYVERFYDLGMAPGALYADAAPAGAIADPVAVQTVATTNYANRGIGEKIGDHFSRNSGRYGLAAAAAAAGYGIYKIGDNQHWWGKKDDAKTAEKPKPLPTQAASTGGGASIQINGDGNTVNVNNGGEGNVTGGGTGQVTQPAAETPATPATPDT